MCIQVFDAWLLNFHYFPSLQLQFHGRLASPPCWEMKQKSGLSNVIPDRPSHAFFCSLVRGAPPWRCSRFSKTARPWCPMTICCLTGPLLALQVRKSICTPFRRQECFTLVRSVHGEQQLQRLDALAPCSVFVARLQGWSGPRPKQMAGVTLTRPMLAALARSFVRVIIQGAMPTFTPLRQVHPYAPLVSPPASWIVTIGGPALDHLPMLRHAGGTLMQPNAV